MSPQKSPSLLSYSLLKIFLPTATGEEKLGASLEVEDTRYKCGFVLIKSCINWQKQEHHNDNVLNL
jgi:hypothetical protein